MFLENTVNLNGEFGWIEVICGSMFSGKTEELIRRLNRAKIAKQKIKVFKPSIDKRYDKEYIISHNQKHLSSSIISEASEILSLSEGYNVVGIDEAQFFDLGIVKVCNDLANKGFRVILAGLDMDYQGNPFGPMPALMATAEYVTKVHAVCARSGNLANHSFRTSKNNSLIHIGEKESYEPLSRVEFQKELNLRDKKKANI
ncbi:MAG: thymidine kinase [Flavobacteriaceae bacterium]|nr:thymidine kinase [Flavobacteriaceae bacterium]|tara:strand:- start:46865 stop:47467 length:603 start_codon:yes stop_codon:yes gene_type:complete